MDLSRVTVLPVVVKFFVGPVCDMVLDGLAISSASAISLPASADVDFLPMVLNLVLKGGRKWKML